MATKKAKEPPAPAGRKLLEIPGDAADREQLIAGLTAEGLFTNAILMQTFSAKVAGEIGITEAVKALRSTIKEVNRGDLSAAETVLVGQAAALNAMFAELARRAGLNMGEHLGAAETYMRLALKAQSQCRATLETLAAIKSPPVVFARQANINNGGQQQVNNGAQAEAPRAPAHFSHASAHAAKPEPEQTGLLGVNDGQGLDTRAPGTASRTDPHLATVGAIDRPAHR